MKICIGFAARKELLDALASLLPEGVGVALMGDRFYGTPDLVDCCRAAGWDWLLRLKDNFTLWVDGEETSKATRTHIGIVGEKGRKEPWIIAMSAIPDYYETMDYGMRRGIECMFSDLKSRGFSLEETQLRYAGRIERLVLVMAVALYRATSSGMWDELNHPMPYEKRWAKKRPVP